MGRSVMNDRFQNINRTTLLPTSADTFDSRKVGSGDPSPQRPTHAVNNGADAAAVGFGPRRYPAGISGFSAPLRKSISSLTRVASRSRLGNTAEIGRG